jgi:hypothetical protein
MRAVLDRIEHLLPGTADVPGKTLLVAIYAMWHRTLAPTDHQPGAPSVLAEHEHLLQRLEVASFVAGLLTDELPDWTVDQWTTLAKDRRVQRSKPRHLKLPAGLDAVLQVMAAQRLMQAGHPGDARTLARFAVEELPGNEALIAWEAQLGLAVGDSADFDVRALALGLEPGTELEAEASDSLGDDGERVDS